MADLPTGPKEPKSTVLTVEEAAVIVAFRRHTLLPLDDCLYSLQVDLSRFRSGQVLMLGGPLFEGYG